MERTLAEGGLLWRLLSAWAGLRASMRAELDRGPSEGRLLFYAMLSGCIWLVGKLMALTFGPAAAMLTSDEFMAYASADVASVFFLTLLLYGLAALGHAVAKAAGGFGNWRESRAALFWAALVAALPALMVQLVALMMADLTGESERVAGWLGALIAGWAAACCIAEAHGLPGVWRGLAVVAVIAVLALVFAGAVAFVLVHVG
jgi:hypothetical protein